MFFKNCIYYIYRSSIVKIHNRIHNRWMHILAVIRLDGFGTIQNDGSRSSAAICLVCHGSHQEIPPFMLAAIYTSTSRILWSVMGMKLIFLSSLYLGLSSILWNGITIKWYFNTLIVLMKSGSRHIKNHRQLLQAGIFIPRGYWWCEQKCPPDLATALLVGGWPTPLKNDWVSWDDDTPIYYVKFWKPCSKPPASHVWRHISHLAGFQLCELQSSTGKSSPDVLSFSPYGVFLKWGNPSIIHSSRIFHEINQPFWGIPIYGTPYHQLTCCDSWTFRAWLFRVLFDEISKLHQPVLGRTIIPQKCVMSARPWPIFWGLIFHDHGANLGYSAKEAR